MRQKLSRMREGKGNERSACAHHTASLQMTYEREKERERDNLFYENEKKEEFEMR